MKIKKMLKPSIKGCIMVIIGILNTRIGIGIGRLTTNLLFGPLAFFFLAISGLLFIEITQILEESSQGNMKIFREMCIFGIMCIIGISITAYNVVKYNLKISIIFFTMCLGILWLFLGLFAAQWKKSRIIGQIITSLAFSIGLLYGAVLNILPFPIFIYFFFLSAFFLQLSRELVKEFNDIKGKTNENESPETLTTADSDQKILKFSLLFQLIAIIFLILPTFTNLITPFLYLYFMIVCLIIIGFATIFTLKSILNTGYNNKKINTILKIGILLEIITFILAS